MVSQLMFGPGLFLLLEVSQKRQGRDGWGRGDKVPGHLQEPPALAGTSGTAISVGFQVPPRNESSEQGEGKGF